MSDSSQPHGPQGSSVHGILHVPIPSSKGSSRSRDRTHVSCRSHIAGSFFTPEPWGSPQKHSIPSSIWISDKPWIMSHAILGTYLYGKIIFYFWTSNLTECFILPFVKPGDPTSSWIGQWPHQGWPWVPGLLRPFLGSQSLGNGALLILHYGVSWSSKPSHRVALRVRKGRSGWWAMAPRGTAVANAGPSWVSAGGDLVTKSCLTLCDLKDCSLPGSSFHGIFQARMLEWVAISFSRGSSWPRDWTCIACISSKLFTTEPPGEAVTSLY